LTVPTIWALARHKDKTTTQRYINYNDSKLLNAIELVS
jgi:integrase/recombinase XerD